jgi:hypothetical protein
VISRQTANRFALFALETFYQSTVVTCGKDLATLTAPMKHSRFKYFSKLEYAEQFLDGEVFCQTAAFFRDYEDAQAQQIIGDEYEGTRLYRPADGLPVNNLTHDRSATTPIGMECATKAHEIFIFCLSLSLNDMLKTEFKAVACAEIFNPRAFIKRWLDALPEVAKKDGKHVASRVAYYGPGDVPGTVWALPDLIITTKLKRFEYQEEYRLAYTTTEAFGFENCNYQLVDRRAAVTETGRTSARNAPFREPAGYLPTP